MQNYEHAEQLIRRVFFFSVYEGNTEMKYAIGTKQLSHVPFRVRLTVFSCLPLFPSNLWNKEIKKIQVK